MHLSSLAALSVALWAAFPAAAESPASLVGGTVIEITANGLPQSVRELPVNVTVITRAQIAASGASTLAGLLAGVAGLNVRSADGREATLDLRGFGASAASNTQLLLDGVKLNDDDLASPRLAGIALDQIERIEIVRGGALVHGGGATGGVIHIVTRGSQDGARVRGEWGSVGHRAMSASMRRSDDNAWFAAQAFARRDTGWRANSGGDAQTASLEVGMQGLAGRAALRYARETQDNRFPGARLVSPAVNLFADEPRASATPKDYGSTEGERLVLSADGQLTDLRWAFDATRRSKSTFGYFDYGGYPTSDRRETLTRRFAPSLAWWPAGRAFSLRAGLDRQLGETDRFSGNGPTADAPAGDSAMSTMAVWVEPALRWGDTRLSAGMRHEAYRLSGRTLSAWAPPASRSSKGSIRAWQLGVRQAVSPEVSLYARWGQSYRLPNADELATNPALMPQRSHDAEVGFDATLDGWRGRLALYRLDLDREIHFQPWAGYNPAFGGYQVGNNVNLDPTRRQGMELNLGRSFGALRLEGMFTLQDARFRSGRYDLLGQPQPLEGKRVPMVPRTLAQLAVSYPLSDALQLAAALRHTGRQRLDNDQPNAAPELSSATTLDARLVWRTSPSVTWTLAGRNLTDRRYASYGVRSTATASRYNLYPADGRTVMVAVELQH
jgi:iron complex outermembrane receptor protein